MKKSLLFICLTVGLFAATFNRLNAQCNSTINWDNLKYLTTTGNYSGWVSSSMETTQRFALGSNMMTIAYSGNITNNGESTASSADAGTDLYYSAVPNSGNTATITLTFDVAVTNLTFSIYDIDTRQRVTVNGKNTGGVDVNTTITRRNLAGLVLSLTPVTGIGTAPYATAANTTVANNNHDGTIDVSITSSVKTVTLTIANTGNVSSSELYISKIVACVASTFPATYYSISKPFTGMPALGYVLTVVNNSIYYTNPLNGASKLLFTDAGSSYINSLAYDPYNRFVYYTYSLTSNPKNDKAVKKFDVNTRTISTIISDVTTLGIPLFDYGVESGSAAFYNGSLFLGIEGYNDDFDEGKKSMVWRIDFNVSNVPYRASQVYAALADDGSGDILHDWSDIGISNGILYDFDGAAGDVDFNVFNMATGVLSNYTPSGSIVGRQVGIGHDEKVYNIDGTITQYNGTNGHTGSTYTMTTSPAVPTTPAPSWGDAAEAFRPFLDFGDAPATYDPSGSDPAVHDSSGTTLRLGANVNVEWLKTGVTSTNDTYDDALAYVPVLNRGHGDYLLRVAVYNNTGANATLCGWLDYAATLGVFSAAEGKSVTVPSSTSIQYVYLYWTGISTTLTNGSFTYLRLRLTSTSNGMTTSNPTGFYANGEVEDYRVLVDNYPLKADLLSFNAKALANDKVELKWNSSGEQNFRGYQIERSADNQNWTTLDFVIATGNGASGETAYTYNDIHPLPGRSYYRLKLVSMDDQSKYSDVRSVTLNGVQQITLLPNPVKDKAALLITTSVDAVASILVSDMNGRIVYQNNPVLRSGSNTIDLPIIARLNSGMYMVRVEIDNNFFTRKLIVQKE